MPDNDRIRIVKTEYKDGSGIKQGKGLYQKKEMIS